MPSSKRLSHDTGSAHLRPYLFHGVALDPRGSHAVGDCPFCGREGKFSVEICTGLWRCFVCAAGSSAGGGNGLIFARLVYEDAAAAILGRANGYPGAFLESVARDRRLLSPDTVAAWGVVPDRDGTWLVPGYGADGKLDQVYRHTRIQDSGGWVWRLLPTPGIWPEGKGHALHLPIGDFDLQCPRILICEGPWDGMALWEVWDRTSGNDNIVAVPGCNVWSDEWTAMCRGKHVTLLFDSDHPREYVSGKVSRAGYDGMVRIAKRLSGAAVSVRYLKWGENGFDQARPSGWDVRDHLTGDGAPMAVRNMYLGDLLSKVETAPREWFSSVSPMVNGHAHNAASVEALPCSTWVECEATWRDAVQWRPELADAMSVLLAVCASTQQAGNQLFLDLIGSPGSLKTTMCRALLVSGHCVHLENATKILSGFKKPGEGDKDCSFLARANGKTWVTCEFDTLATLPQYHELMGKIRRIFDGETSVTYGNDDKDRIYTALRTPWIRAGTPRMMDHDQSQLGDRFLRFILTDPGHEEKRSISRSALRSERSAILETANAISGSILDPKTRNAYALTGGYVDWLRAHVEEELGKVDISVVAEEYCIDLAELSADLRARPTDEKKRVESYDVKELPTRLARQNIRLASCLAVVLNRLSVDADVLRVVKKVALDTATGHSLNIAHWLCSPNPHAGYKIYQECGGLGYNSLEMWTRMSPERFKKYIDFLKAIDVLQFREVKQSAGVYLLTERVYGLYLRVMRGADL